MKPLYIHKKKMNENADKIQFDVIDYFKGGKSIPSCFQFVTYSSAGKVRPQEQLDFKNRRKPCRKLHYDDEGD